MENKSSLYRFFVAIVKPPYQLIALVITSSIVLYLLWLALGTNRVLERPTAILPITPQKIKEWGGEPTIVETGLFITNWHKFDMRENEFIFDGMVWFQFDPALISIDTIGKFSFEKGEILHKSAPDTKLIDGLMFAEYEVRLRFTTSLDYKLFPLDDHEIYIGLINNSLAPSEAIYKVNKYSFATSENVFVPNWKLIDYDVQSGYENQQIDRSDDKKTIRIPKVIYMLDFRRTGINLAMIILLPLFLIFFVGLFSYAFDPEMTGAPIVSIVTTGVTSLIAYRFVIQRISPSTGYFLLSDLMFMLFLAFAFIKFLIGMIVVKHGKLMDWVAIVRGITFILFHVAAIVVWAYLLFFWH